MPRAQERSTNARPARVHGATEGSARLGAMVAVLALLLTAVMIAIGVSEVLRGRADPAVILPASGPIHEHETSNADDLVPTGFQPGAASLATVSFVDVWTGRTGPLPRAITAIGPWVGGFRVSPDGRRLAFTDGTRIYVSTVGGQHVRPVTDGPSASAPGWAPNGRRLVFASGGKGWIVHLSTGVVRRVIGGQPEIYRPEFTGDGRGVLFSRSRGTSLALWEVPSSGGKPQLFLERAAFGSYSPDGSMIAFRRTSYDGSDVTEMTQEQVWIAATDGGEVHGTGPNRASMSQIDPGSLWPVWSPDGSLIAYERLYGQGVIVLDPETGRVVARFDGTDPGWLDDTLILAKGGRA